jgi:hypothetical protein
MKTVFTTAAIVASMMAVASTAYAKDCAAVAQAAVDAETHPGGSALVGCGIGAGLGAIFGKGNTGSVVGGCAAGGAGGLVLSAAKAKKIYDQAYAACQYGNGGSQQVNYTTFPAPSSTANTPYSTSVNVRSGPGKNFAVTEKLPANTTVSVGVCASTGWCQVGGYSGPGWVSQSLLTFN